MEERKQFTFYRSYYEAVMKMPVRARGPMLLAIVAYALDNTEPESQAVAQNPVFTLIRPLLDASRKKADSGRIGGSKPKANCKQTESKIKDKDKYKNKVKDKSLQDGLSVKELFDPFWEAYPKKIGRNTALTVWQTMAVDEPLCERIMAALQAWKECEQWKKDCGKYIPYPAKWLEERYFDASPEVRQLTGAQGYLGQAELEAIEQVPGN